MAVNVNVWKSKKCALSQQNTKNFEVRCRTDVSTEVRVIVTERENRGDTCSVLASWG